MTSLELVPWRGATVPVLQRDEIARYSTTDYLNWITSGNGYMGPPMPVTTYGNRPAEPIGNSFLGFVQGMLYADGPVAAAEQYRLRVFGQAPMLYQELTDGRPGDLFDDKNLDLVRAPWPGATLSDLMKRALIFGDFAGNSFGLNLEDEIVLVRPDWVEIILAKRMYRDVQVGWKQVGIMYYEGGCGTGDGAPFLPGEYFHFVPGLPDPLANYRGMSWLTPLIREVQADKSASEHKLAFFENAASPNLAVSLPKEVTPTQFDQFVELMDAKHKGAANAYKTLYTGGGADVTVVGANMQQMDFSAVQGKGETRIANAAGVPPVLLSFSEGMQGSSLNAGNYTAAKRNFVDTTMRDLWMNFAGSIQQMEYFWAPLPKTRLWYDGRDIPFLHEDAADIASRQQTQASALSSMVTNGWVPESAKEWLAHDDLQVLKHSGAFSVQLQPPGAQDTNGDGQADDFAAPEDLQNFDFGALRDGVGEAARAKYNIRHDKGTKGGGKFRRLSDVAVPLLKDWLKGKGDGDPLKQFNRDQLRTISKDLATQARDAGDHERAARLTPRRKVSEAELKKALYEDASGKKSVLSQAGPQEAAKPAQGGAFGVTHQPSGGELTYEDALDAGDRDTAVDATVDDFRERRGREPSADEMDRIERNVDGAIKRRERKQGPAQSAPAPEATTPPAEPAAPPAPAETPAPAGPRSAAAAPLTGLLTADRATAKAEVSRAIDGEYAGGLGAKVTDVTVHEGVLSVYGDITGPDGTKVGHFDRSYTRRPDGVLVARHQKLMVDPDHQGAGFASDFNANLIAWYRRSGFDQVDTYADEDVGGYAWPAQGFDFADVDMAGDNVESMVDQLTDMPDDDFAQRFPGWSREAFAEQSALLGEAARDRIRDGDMSAYEVSQMGRQSGQGRNDWWIGKAVLIGTEFDAVLPLTDGGDE